MLVSLYINNCFLIKLNEHEMRYPNANTNCR